MKVYKGFEPDMTCRGFQYKEGETYTEEKAEICVCGFHACLAPLDTFSYYPPIDGNTYLPNKYHVVELSITTGEIEVENEDDDSDTKVCGNVITVGKELNLYDIAVEQIKYSKEHELYYSSLAIPQTDSCSTTVIDESYSGMCILSESALILGQDISNLVSVVGDYSMAICERYLSGAIVLGDGSVAMSLGTYSMAGTFGVSSISECQGMNSLAVAMGNVSLARNREYHGIALAFNNDSAAEVNTEESIAIAFGRDSRAKGALGSYLLLTEWYMDKIKDVKVFKVDGKKIKADTYYVLCNGKAVKANE